MTGFLNAVDIANRALDHCGQEPIDETLGFTEVSKKAALAGRLYPKLRQAELRRNVWRFAIKKAVLRAVDVNTMLLAPAMWVSTTTYFVGSIVSDQYNQLWTSRIPNNLGNDPLNSSVWEQYFGPMSVSLFDSTVSYAAGELVYTTAGDGTARTYLSRESSNQDVPGTATAWDDTVTYKKNQVVTYSSVAYMSLIDFNLNQQPDLSAAPWAVGTTYAAGEAVAGSDGIKYTSVGSGNVGHDPTTDAGVHWTNTGILVPWTTSFVGGTGSVKWLQIGGVEFPMGVGLAELNIVYPLGTGPSSQSTSRNIYRLPAGYLRKAPVDPKAGSTSYLGAEYGLGYSDWLFQDHYIISGSYGTIVFAFVADTVDVTAMDPMFCEGLAARMGLEMCEPLTQSNEKLKTIASIYQQHMVEARIVNGIETGSEEPPVDDYIACRY